MPQDFSQSNFGFAEYTDEQGKKRPMYEITRDGFTLLAMGFTGKKAMEFKIKYIEAFNAMEKSIKGSVPVMDNKTLGGIVKKCCGVAVREELSKIEPTAILNQLIQERANEIARVMIGVKLEQARTALEWNF